ncbi:MAG: hypothetical protein L0G23_02565 [Ruaniaceae bacterium]|nr:hypothetical protein [Ruaniaceae bacterium]
MTWWRRNRIWLWALVPLLALAIVASSFRLFTLYLAWEWSRPTVAEGPIGMFHQTFQAFDGVERDREVQVEVLSVLSYPRLDGVRAVDGGVLWRVWLEFEAEPDQILDGCYVELTDEDGNRYDTQGGLEAADENGYFVTSVLQRCVPEEAPGPVVEALSGEFVESPIERPRTWRSDALIAMPEGVEPVGVRIGWREPEYLVLEVP